MDIIYFPDRKELRRWFERNHNKADELLVGYYKKGTGQKSITWSESVDEALCFGWIDGVRKSIDSERYMIRFTPRRKGSIWSANNIKKMNNLIEKGLVKEAGLQAFKNLDEKKSRVYSFEQEKVHLSAEYEKKLKANKDAWKFFQKLPPSAKRPSMWYVMSAKKKETQLRRLDLLIKCSAEGKRIPQIDITRRKER